MILIKTDNPRLENTSKALAKFNAFEAMDRALRSMFDNAICKATATGAIQAAKDLGRTDIASEMEADLRDELGDVA